MTAFCYCFKLSKMVSMIDYPLENQLSKAEYKTPFKGWMWKVCNQLPLYQYVSVISVLFLTWCRGSLNSRSLHSWQRIFFLRRKAAPGPSPLPSIADEGNFAKRKRTASGDSVWTASAAEELCPPTAHCSIRSLRWCRWSRRQKTPPVLNNRNEWWIMNNQSRINH